MNPKDVQTTPKSQGKGETALPVNNLVLQSFKKQDKIK